MLRISVLHIKIAISAIIPGCFHTILCRESNYHKSSFYAKNTYFLDVHSYAFYDTVIILLSILMFDDNNSGSRFNHLSKRKTCCTNFMFLFKWNNEAWENSTGYIFNSIKQISIYSAWCARNMNIRRRNNFKICA